MSSLIGVWGIETINKDRGNWYLATPYSKWAHGIDDANIFASELAGRLIRSGVPVFSPIAHTHGIAIIAKIDPFDHEIWLKADGFFMRDCIGLLVADAPGWRESKGVLHEIKTFREAKKACFLLDTHTLDYRALPSV